MELTIKGPVWFWRGPSPFHFVTLDEASSESIHTIAAGVTYGWGMIPCQVTIGTTTYTTSLWPKDGGYILPVKAAVRKAESIEVGDVIQAEIFIA